MAFPNDRYWVGNLNGQTSWTAGAAGRWSTTSGGAAGASVPTTANDVYFDANSGSGSVTVNIANAACANLILTGYTGTLTASATGAIGINGNLTLSNTGIFDPTNRPPITFVNTSPATITSNGQSVGTITINCTGTSVTLADDLITQNNTQFTLLAGTFNANNKNVSVGRFVSTSTTSRTLTMGAGTWTMMFFGAQLSPEICWDTQVITGLTFNKGTAKIRLLRGAATAGLSSALTTTSNSITLIDTGDTQWSVQGSAGGTILIDNELISYTTLVGNTLGGTVVRGVNGTTPASHSSGTAVYLITQPAGTLTGSDILADTVPPFNITISNDIFFSNNSTIRIDSEEMTYSAKVGSTLTINARGLNGTTQAEHTVGANVISINRRLFYGGGLTFGTVELVGIGSLEETVIYNSNTFTDITSSFLNSNASFTKQNHILYLESGTTNTFGTWSISGSLGTPVIVRSLTSGTQATMVKSSSADRWYLGTNSVSVSNNTNLIIGGGGGVNYLSFQDIYGLPAPTNGFFSFF
jgi:hypothetical protein